MLDDMPPRIAALPRDGRGYPIPYIVLRTPDGAANFAANDLTIVAKADREGLCHVCGQALDGEPPWFAGGPGSAFLNSGWAFYQDGPMHHECSTYALRICPHLAHRMTKPVAPAVKERLRRKGVTLFETPLVGPAVPAVFVAVSGYRFTRHPANGHYAIPKPFRKIEYWRDGALLPRDEGERYARRAARELRDALDRGDIPV